MTAPTDRELLELAAKATGIELGPHWTWGLTTGGATYWDPLESDSQALRLAVRLSLMDGGVALCLNSRLNSYGFAQCYTNEQVISPIEDMSLDPYAATRRAIVRAAAEIGKAMP